MPRDNQPLDFSFLRHLTQTFGPAGVENQVSALITKEIQPYCDTLENDLLGNLIATKQGDKIRIMVSAHMDEIGLMITHIDAKGFLRFTPIGGVHLPDLLHRRVQFQDGFLGTIGVEKLEKLSDLKFEKLYIDIGAASQTEAESKVKIGDCAVFAGEYHDMGTKIMAKSIDNRVGCFVTIEALKRVQSEHTLVFAFTAQEEVGLRGARPAAYSIEPNINITVDVTFSGDTPKAPTMAVQLDNGVAIKVMDRSIVTPPIIKNWMEKTAIEHHLPYQFEVLESGGTDSGAIQLSRGGVLSGAISIPARYIHSPSEIVAKKDIEAAIALLVALLEKPIDF